jgi:hypothetical protein
MCPLAEYSARKPRKRRHAADAPLKSKDNSCLDAGTPALFCAYAAEQRVSLASSQLASLAAISFNSCHSIVWPCGSTMEIVAAPK